MNLKLINYRMNEFNFKLLPKPEESKTFKILPKFQCKIAKNADNVFANLIMTIESTSAQPTPFNINSVMFGHYKMSNGTATDTELTQMIFKDLYPLVRSAIATLTLNLNIPAYLLPNMDGGIETRVDNAESNQVLN